MGYLFRPSAPFRSQRQILILSRAYLSLDLRALYIICFFRTISYIFSLLFVPFLLVSNVLLFSGEDLGTRSPQPPEFAARLFFSKIRALNGTLHVAPDRNQVRGTSAVPISGRGTIVFAWRIHPTSLCVCHPFCVGELTSGKHRPDLSIYGLSPSKMEGVRLVKLNSGPGTLPMKFRFFGSRLSHMLSRVSFTCFRSGMVVH